MRLGAEEREVRWRLEETALLSSLNNCQATVGCYGSGKRNYPQKRGKVLALDWLQDTYYGLLLVCCYSSISSSMPRTH